MSHALGEKESSTEQRCSHHQPSEVVIQARVRGEGALARGWRRLMIHTATQHPF